MTRFALFDVEGAFLNAGEELTINEPAGYRDFLFSIERDMEYRGINAEFGEGDTELGFDWNVYDGEFGTEIYSPHRMLKSIFEDVGFDAKVFLRVYNVQGSVEVLEYEWILIFKSAEEIDSRISFRVKRENFGDKLRTRFDTDVNVSGNTSLDGEPVQALEMIELPLHSRVIQLNSFGDWNNISPLSTGVAQNTTDLFVGLMPSVFSLDEIPRNGYQTNAYEPQAPAYFIAPNNGWYDIDLEVTTTDGILSVPSGNSIINQELQIVTSDISDTATKVVTGPDIFGVRIAKYTYSNRIYITRGDALFIQLFNPDGGGFIFNLQDSFINIIGDTYAPPSTIQGHFIYEILNDAMKKAIGQDFGTVITVTLIGVTGTFQVGEIISNNFTSQIGTGQILTVDGSVLTIRVIDPFVLGIVEGATSGASGIISEILLPDILESSILTRGQSDQYPGLRIVVRLLGVSGTYTPGEIVTSDIGGSGTLISITPLSVGQRAVIEVITPIEGIGSGAVLTGQTSGATGIAFSATFEITDGIGALNFVTTGKRIRQLPDEPLNVTCSKLVDFVRCRYNAGMMVYPDKVGVELAANYFRDVKIMTLGSVESPTKRGLNNELLYNEVESGYIKFAKENENSSIRGFNTVRNWLTPIEKEKKKLSLIAPVVTDGSEIERVRRLNIKQDESDQSDDQIFIIKCQRFYSNNPINESQNDTERNYLTIEDSNDRIILNGFYLKGQIQAGDEFIYRVIFIFTTYEQTVEIVSVTFDAANNRTILEVTEPIDLPDGDHKSNYSFYFNKSIYLPERIEAFVTPTVTGVVDKYSEYNIDHSPTMSLIRWHNFFGATLTTKAGTKKVRFTQGTNNISLSRRYRSGENSMTTSVLTDDQDFLLSSLRAYNPEIFKPYEWEIVCYIDESDFITLRASLLGQGGSPDTDFGFIEFYDNFSTLVQIFPNIIKRNPTTNRTEIVGWEKQVPTPEGTHYILQETGDRIELESGTGFMELEY